MDSLSLDSAVTALPSNFQPLYTSGHSRGLRTWVIVVVAVVAALLLVSVFLCCCWPYLCCCRKQRSVVNFGSTRCDCSAGTACVSVLTRCSDQCRSILSNEKAEA